MFTGIVQKTGRVKKILQKEKLFLMIGVKDFLPETKIGESIAVDGVCLTMIDVGENFFTSEVMPETAKVTTLGDLKVGDEVNLELALKLSDRLDGHLVLGHIDGVGVVKKVVQKGADVLMTIEPPKALRKFIPYKGAISVNGVSLTIAKDEGTSFTVALISHTLAVTNLSDLKVGDKVNLEVDIVARYLEKLKVIYATKR